MGASTTKLKRWVTGENDEDSAHTYERALKRVATPFVYTRKG